MLCRRLIRGALVPLLGLFQRRKFGDCHALWHRPFEHLLATIGRQELDWQALKARRRQLRVGIEFGLVSGALAYEDHVGRHLSSLESVMSFNGGSRLCR